MIYLLLSIACIITLIISVPFQNNNQHNPHTLNTTMKNARILPDRKNEDIVPAVEPPPLEKFEEAFRHADASTFDEVLGNTKLEEIHKFVMENPHEWKHLDTNKRAIFLLGLRKRLDESALAYLDNEILKLAVINNTNELATRLIEQGITVDVDYSKAIFYAIENNKLDLLRLLLKGKKVKIEPVRSTTSLHKACEKNNYKMVQLLLAHGADPTLKDNGISPLDIARSHKNKQIIKALSPLMPLSVEKKDKKQQFLELLSIDSYDEDKIKNILLEQPRLLNKTDENGNTLLHLAVLIPDIEMIRWLLASGANCEKENLEHKKPSELAEQKAILDIFAAHANQIHESVLEKKYYATIPLQLFDAQYQGHIIAEISFDMGDKNNHINFVIEKKIKNRNKFIFSFIAVFKEKEDEFIFQKPKGNLSYDNAKKYKNRKKINYQDWFVSDLKVQRTNGKLFLRGSTRLLASFSWELLETL